MGDQIDGAAFNEVRDMVNEHDQWLKGAWATDSNGAPVRIPGVLELAKQNSDDTREMMKQLRKRDADEEVRRSEARKVAWSIGKPIVILIAILVLIELARLIASNGDFIKGHAL